MGMNGTRTKESPEAWSFHEMTGRTTGSSSREVLTRCPWAWRLGLEVGGADFNKDGWSLNASGSPEAGCHTQCLSQTFSYHWAPPIPPL